MSSTYFWARGLPGATGRCVPYCCQSPTPRQRPLTIWHTFASSIVRFVAPPLIRIRITTGLDVVRNMKSIRQIGTTIKGVMPPEQFWKLVDEGKLR